MGMFVIFFTKPEKPDASAKPIARIVLQWADIVNCTQISEKGKKNNSVQYVNS